MSACHSASISRIYMKGHTILRVWCFSISFYHSTTTTELAQRKLLKVSQQKALQTKKCGHVGLAEVILPLIPNMYTWIEKGFTTAESFGQPTGAHGETALEKCHIKHSKASL